MIRRNARDIGEEAGRAEGLVGHAGADALGLFRAGNVPQDGQGLAQGLGAGRCHQELTAIQVLGIEALVFLPEPGIDAVAELVGIRIIPGGVRPAQHRLHPGQDAERLVVHAAGTQVFAVVNIGTIHPQGIFLLSPVQEGVGGNGPAAAAARILDDTPAFVDFPQEALLGGFGLDVRHCQERGITHVPGPDAGPFPTRAEGGIRLYGILALLQGQVIHGFLIVTRSLIGSKAGNVPRKFPAALRLVGLGVIGNQGVGIRGACLVMTLCHLGYAVGGEDEGIGFPNGPLSTGPSQKAGKHQGGNASIHVCQFLSRQSWPRLPRNRPGPTGLHF